MSQNRSKICDFAPTRSVWLKISGRRGCPTPIISARWVRPMNALQLCHRQFSHEETLKKTLFKRSAILDEKQLFCVFGPPLGDLGATYDDHLRLIGKRVANFWLVLIELLSLGVTAEALRSNIGSKSAILLQRGSVDLKFQVEGITPTNHSSSQKTRLNDLSYGTDIWTDFSSTLPQCTHSRDGRTDRQNSHRYTASAFHAARWKQQRLGLSTWDVSW